jgi:hypothetical protein
MVYSEFINWINENTRRNKTYTYSDLENIITYGILTCEDGVVESGLNTTLCYECKYYKECDVINEDYIQDTDMKKEPKKIDMEVLVGIVFFVAIIFAIAAPSTDNDIAIILSGLLLIGAVIGVFVLYYYKKHMTGMYSSFKQCGDSFGYEAAVKVVEAEYAERYREEIRRSGGSVNRYFKDSDGDPVKKTGKYSKECEARINQLKEEYGIYGSDRYLIAKGKSEAWEKGIRDEAGLEKAGQDSIREYREYMRVEYGVGDDEDTETIKEDVVKTFGDYKLPSSDLL